ncbi:MAG: acyloxyacyl hydrolase [Mucilaginibacter sp.]
MSAFKIVLVGLMGYCFYFPPIHAQRPWQIEAAFTQGNFYSHADFRVPLLRPMRSLAFSICRPTAGERYWQQLHRYPDMGLRLKIRDMGNPAVYGYTFSIIPYLNFYPWKKDKWGISIAHGTGLSYITKIYSAHNPYNRLISSHINAASFLYTGIYYQPQAPWRITTTLEMSHESNGNIQKNNRGFNTWAVGIAFRRTWNGPARRLAPFVPTGPSKGWLFSAELSCGLHDYDTYTKQIQVTPEATAAIWRQHNDRFRSYLGLGYNVYPFPLIERAAFVLVGEEVLLGAMSVRYSLGTYLSHTGPELRLIEKVGISYYPFKNMGNSIPARIAKGIYIGAYLKAHGSVAAHIELTVGNVF